MIARRYRYKAFPSHVNVKAIIDLTRADMVSSGLLEAKGTQHESQSMQAS